MVSITDELREWYKDRLFMGNGWAEIDAIADRIDAAHRSALEKLAAQVDESEDGWMRLPVDADGVPIHIGDVMEVKFDTKRRPFTVSFVGERAVAFWVVGQHDLKSFNLDTVLVTHHHAPTALDTLLELLNEYRDGGGTISEARLSDYAAKLRLAGEE